MIKYAHSPPPPNQQVLRGPWSPTHLFPSYTCLLGFWTWLYARFQWPQIFCRFCFQDWHITVTNVRRSNRPLQIVFGNVWATFEDLSNFSHFEQPEATFAFSSNPMQILVFDTIYGMAA